MSKRLDLSGKILEFLTVVDFAFVGTDGRSRWNCICICGKQTIISSVYLFDGSRSSCGCKRKFLQALKTGMELSELAYRTIFNDSKNGAKTKCNEFNLYFEYFRKLLTSNCFYCGIDPVFR